MSSSSNHSPFISFHLPPPPNIGFSFGPLPRSSRLSNLDPDPIGLYRSPGVFSSLFLVPILHPDSSMFMHFILMCIRLRRFIVRFSLCVLSHPSCIHQQRSKRKTKKPMLWLEEWMKHPFHTEELRKGRIDN
jgi:hypothetical protein